ncbi:MAG: sodium:proton antiporter, partial [Cytophagales bacterium]|nr:sodium:proton antiporter [Cytophagales bacterium]
MENLETVVGLLFVITLLAIVADKVHMPFPILLVIVGILASLVPGLPIIELSPEVVFLVFLPPLLYGAAWGTSWHDFKKAKRSITLLAVGCVLFTTTAVAVAAHYLIPGFSWPLSFLLGAIISPPDAVAATSVISKLGISKRVVTILEGESLVNDASGLIAYKYAMAAVITGNFVLMDASIQFVWVSIGGIGIGLGVALIMMVLHKRIKKNTVVNIVLTFLTPFIAYLISETFHLSGVLAVVACGLYLSFKSSEIFTHDTRMQAVAVWQTVVFILNALVFILIGLQMRKIIEGINEYSFWVMLGYGFVISLVTMVGRLIWVFPGAYLPRILSKRIREKEPRPDWRQVLLVGWTGMRGVVSLAAGLALPLVIND